MELKTTRQFLILFLFFMIIFSACYYDVEDQLYPIETCRTENMSYVNDIVPLIKDNCNVCHAASQNLGNITLEDYSNVKKHAEDGSLIGSIKHVGYSPMPKGGSKLSDCTISKIEAWIVQGALNN